MSPKTSVTLNLPLCHIEGQTCHSEDLVIYVRSCFRDFQTNPFT